MKSKNYWVLFPLCFLLVFCFGGCQKGTEGEPGPEENVTPPQEQTEFEQLITANEGMQKRMEKDKEFKTTILSSLEEQIKEDNEKLKEYFKEGQIKGMAELSNARSTKIVGPNYERISGKKIKEFWMEKVSKDKELHIETVHVYLSDTIGEKKIQRAMEKEPVILDGVAVVVRVIRILSKGPGGEVLKNDTLMETSTYLHRHDCPFDG